MSLRSSYNILIINFVVYTRCLFNEDIGVETTSGKFTPLS